MATIDPVVRHMLLADDITSDPSNPNKINLRGLVHAVRLKQPVRLPAMIDQLCVLLFLSGGRGIGRAQILGIHDDDDQPAFGSAIHTIRYPPDPLEALTRSFRLRRCVIPRMGLYWIQFWHDGRMLDDQPLMVR